MKKQVRITRWFILMAIAALALAACGPAPVPDSVEVEESDTAVVEDDHGEESTDHEETSSDNENTVVEESPSSEEPPPVGPPADAPTELEYIEITAGAGATPQMGDIVTINYSIGAIGEEPFDSSFDRDEPISMPMGIGQLLPGWEEGLLLMKEGGRATLIIPAELAFGDQGLPGMVEPFAPIVSEIELITVERPEPPIEVDEDDYTVTDSGLKIYDIEEGSGGSPQEGDSVLIDFAIWRDDGVVIGRSAEQDGAMTFALGGGELFEGWEEGVMTMEAGGKRQLFIPADLAFGEIGAGDAIPPNTDLIIEMELLEIIQPPKMTEVDEDDYTTTDSGLQYFDLEEGDGASPEEGQLVSVHYTGWLEDGTVFDSSVGRGEPFQFPLGQGRVIAGWDEGVADMKIGGKRQLRIPSDLAYGDQGSGSIPPGSTLIFEVELLNVE